VRRSFLALTKAPAMASSYGKTGEIMPIYEYRCEKCGDFEATQKMTDEPLTQCPTCRRKVTKLISSTSFQLKGSGWYATDYGAKPAAKADDTKKGSSEGGAAEAGAGSSKTDSGGPDKKSSDKPAAA